MNNNLRYNPSIEYKNKLTQKNNDFYNKLWSQIFDEIQNMNNKTNDFNSQELPISTINKQMNTRRSATVSIYC
jgi:hypothetical protein